MSTVYDDFQDAWVGRVCFGEDASRLADARRWMEARPGYDAAKYEEAVFRAERTVKAFHAVMRESP